MSKQLNVRIPEDLFSLVEQDSINQDTTKSGIVIGILLAHYDTVDIQNANNTSIGSDNRYNNVTQMLLDEKDRRISFLEDQIDIKDQQIMRSQVTSQTMAAKQTGLMEKIRLKLKGQ
jgi:hypothetical protein